MKGNDTTSLSVPVRPDSPLSQVLSQVSPEYITSMPSETAEDKVRLFHALTGDHLAFRSLLNETVDLLGWLLKPSSPQLSADGEVTYYPVDVMILVDGRCIVGGSKGVTQCLSMFESIRGPCPWSPPIRVKLRSRPLEPPKVWNFLELVDIGIPGRSPLVSPPTKKDG